MALKDWKKKKEDVWKRVNGNYIYITWYGSQGNVKYDVLKTSNINYGGMRLKNNFKSKSAALSFAKSYMRSH